MKVSDQLLKVYTDATTNAMKNNQVVGENNDYYVTLEQLMAIISQFAESV